MNNSTHELTARLAITNLWSLKRLCHQAALGFTLIELLVSLGLSALGATGGMVLYSSSRKSLEKMEATAEVQQGFRKAFEAVILEVQETNTSTIDTSVPHAISFASAMQNGVFQTNNDGTPNWQNAVVYFLDPSTNTLCRYTAPKSDWTTTFNTVAVFDEEDPEQLVTDVTGLDFYLSGNVLTVIMECAKDLHADTENPLTAELAVQVYLRN